MAKYNEILVGRFNNALKKLFGMKGPAPSPQLSGEITAALPLFFGAEARFLEEWHLFALQIQLAAGGAGNRAQVKVRNPAGSNVIAVFQKIAFVSALADQPFINQERPSTTDLAAFPAADVTSLDARTGRRSTSMVLSQNNAGPSAVPGNGVWIGGYPAASQIEAVTTDIQEFPLLPGDAYSFACGTLNQADAFTAMWRERFLEDSERA